MVGVDREAISGIVLAGGHGRRMGTDKRAVEVLGVPLLDRALTLLEPLVDELLIITRDQDGALRHARILSDEVAERGPMAGLLTGLRAARYSRVLVIPVDMPLLTSDFLGYLVQVSAGWDITVPQWRAGIEPLVGVYTASCIAALEDQITHRASMRDFVLSTRVAVRYVREPELRRLGDPARLFFDVDTREDVRLAEAMLQDRALCPPVGSHARKGPPREKGDRKDQYGRQPHGERSPHLHAQDDHRQDGEEAD